MCSPILFVLLTDVEEELIKLIIIVFQCASFLFSCFFPVFDGLGSKQMSLFWGTKPPEATAKTTQRAFRVPWGKGVQIFIFYELCD